MPADPHDELAAAIAAERAAWERVKARMPGTRDFDEPLWAAWQNAVQRCREARQAIDAAAGGPSLPGAQESDRDG